MSEATTVYIDGSCVRNGASTAKAGYGLYWGVDHPWNGSYTIPTEEGATNNKAELRAAIKAVEVARDNGIQNLVINSDSKYVVLGITQWSDNWVSNGWKTANGDSVKNKEDWKQLLQLINDSDISITWKHVPGHRGISGNEEADKLAVRGASGQGKIQKCNDGATLETPPVSKMQPKVIVIGNVSENQRKDVKAAVDPLNHTPRRKLGKDNSDTPVPGCVNGSIADKSKTKMSDSKKGGKDNQTLLIENNQLTQAIKNMETVLETVVLGLNQSREDNFKFQKDVMKKLEEITSKQLVFEESLSGFSKELGAETRNANSRMQIAQASISMEDNLKLNQDVSKKLEEITCKQDSVAESQSKLMKELASDRKNVNYKFEGLKSSLHTVEISCSELKRGVEKASASNKTECDEIQSVGKKIYEAITEVRNENKRTREQVGDIEKSISAISEAGLFSTSTKAKKARDNSVKENSLSSQADKDDGKTRVTDDVEITYSDVATRAIQDAQKKSNAEQESESESEVRPQQGKPGSRKDKVYLIGDSLVGQINVPLLGKSTNTYVRRLKAPKIADIESYSDEVKNAKLIVIHTGINNLRDRESTESCVKSMVTAITGLKEKAKDAKIVVSKIAPVGDRELSIEGTILNASCEKKVREIHDDIKFLDHSNLAEQGVPIKTFYRPDMLHFSYTGVINFDKNLRRVIEESLNHKDNLDQSLEIAKPRDGRSAVQGRKYWQEGRRRSDMSDVDHHRGGQYDTYNRHDRRESYGKADRYENHSSEYRRRTGSVRRDYGRDRDYYYHDRQRRYEDRYEDNLNRGDRYYNHSYDDDGHFYHSQYDRDYHRR